MNVRAEQNIQSLKTSCVELRNNEYNEWVNGMHIQRLSHLVLFAVSLLQDDTSLFENTLAVCVCVDTGAPSVRALVLGLAG